MLDHLIDPDPDSTEAEFDAANASFGRLAKTVEKISGHGCTIDADGDNDRMSVMISFHGLTLAEIEEQFSELVNDLYEANKRRGGVK